MKANRTGTKAERAAALLIDAIESQLDDAGGGALAEAVCEAVELIIEAAAGEKARSKAGNILLNQEALDTTREYLAAYLAHLRETEASRARITIQAIGHTVEALPDNAEEFEGV